ncbi:hypothetical protein SteCoe_9360 [Stentor coeruleus]|uniref:Uncharacterized protein n=1 Tax=Stentor coeruleus TaxID=5963 RepID=A0A1R2CI35_9CILI|nr:hypothetical protein SteCoe_9360 [Stentor coeruleus]
MNKKDPLEFLSSIILAEQNNHTDIFLYLESESNISNLGKNCLDIHTNITNIEERLDQYLTLYKNIYLSSITPKSQFYLIICNDLINKNFLLTQRMSNKILLRLENQEYYTEDINSHINFFENEFSNNENHNFSLAVIKSPSSDKNPHKPISYKMALQWTFTLQDVFKLKKNKSTKIIFTNQGDYVTVHQLAKNKNSDIGYIEIISKELKLLDSFEIGNTTILVKEIFQEKLMILIESDLNSLPVTLSESKNLHSILSENEIFHDSLMLIKFKKKPNSWFIKNKSPNYPLYCSLSTSYNSENHDFYRINNTQKIKLLDYIFEANIN